MRHPFRAWLEDQPINEAARALFDEGIICYSAGAYRAALVFSYIGFLRTVAHRLMIATRPINVPETLWNQIQTRVREDLTWEDTTYDSLQRQQPASLFLLDEDLRNQLQYWRGRRNDAAHARTNEIAAVHVESFWLFVRSNLSRIIVSGGRIGLFERFRRHFDPGYTPPEADFSHLVREIPQSVRPQEYRDFLRDLLQLTGDIETPEMPVDEYPDLTKRGTLLLRHIDSLQDQHLREAVADELRQDQRLLIGALLNIPSLTLYFAREGAVASFMRKLWRDLLPFERDQYYHPHPISRSLGVVAFMLRNSLIPAQQREEALNHILDKLFEGYPHGEYSDEVLDELAPFGFWEAVHHRAFAQGWNGWWLSRNIILGIEYLTRFPVDVHVARAFAALVPEESEEGDAYLQKAKFYEPEDAYDLRYFYFREHPDKLEELAKVARENDIDITHFLRLMDPNQSEDDL